jgi:RimJ/RimL family protein N-acetyltransferase
VFEALLDVGWAEKGSVMLILITEGVLSMRVIETERLSLRHLAAEDGTFILELVNEPAFIAYIGDKGVRTTEDAVQYILNGPVASYARFGFGLYAVELKDSGVPIGMCGLLKRDTLEDVDIGFAFLERFRSKGYGYESAAAVLDYGRTVLGIARIVAITAPENPASIRLLEKLGLRFEKMIHLPGYDGDTRLFVPAWAVRRWASD